MKTVKIGYADYEIQEDKIAEKYDKLGRITYAPQCIIVDSTLNKRQGTEVLLHEILHGISTMFLETELTEKQVNVMGNGLSGCIRDNQKLFKELLDNLK